jgi:hypothetical protein
LQGTTLFSVILMACKLLSRILMMGFIFMNSGLCQLSTAILQCPIRELNLSVRKTCRFIGLDIFILGKSMKVVPSKLACSKRLGRSSSNIKQNEDSVHDFYGKFIEYSVALIKSLVACKRFS